MRYADRVILITEVSQEDFLGDKIIKKESQPIPCFRSGLTIEEQMAVFGKYSLDSFKLYLKGYYDGFETVKYHDKTLMIAGKIHHNNYTVIYL